MKRRSGRGPTVVFLGGFASDMEGTKALALDAWAGRRGRALVRFDYFGHGASSGDFRDGTIGRWRSDALAVIDELTTGPLILVGSSMGGWIAALIALARPSRVTGLALIAPAFDFTSKLLEPSLTALEREELKREGVVLRTSPYGGGHPIAEALIEEGRSWTLLPGPVELDAPTRILQGGTDPDVPWRHALAAAEAIRSADVVFTLVKDADHRFSRPQDVARMIEALEELSALGA